MGKKVFLGLSMLLFSAAVSAAPQLSVDQSSFAGTYDAREDHGFNVTFTNQDSSEKIFDVSLQDTDYVEWSGSGFDLNASNSTTVTGVFRTEEPRNINETLRIPYSYNGSNSTGLESNESLYPGIQFDVETQYESTSVDINVLRKDFELQLGETGESYIEVSNSGSETAFNVDVDGDGETSFKPSSFNVSSDSTQLVEYNVSIPKPESNATEATNQTYTRQVTVSGENFESVTFEAEVFVPYKEYVQDETTYLDQLIQLQESCEKNPDLPGCGGDPYVVYENRTETVYRQPEANVTLENTSIAAINELGREYPELENNISRMDNRTRSLVYTVEKLANITERNNEEIDQVIQEDRQEDEQEKQRRQARSNRNLLIFLALLLVTSPFAGYKAYKIFDREFNDPRI